MRVFDIEGSRLTSEAAFWSEYLAAVQPDGSAYFGRNLAAFRDAVTAGGPGWPGEHCRLRILDHTAAKVSAEFLAELVEIANESDQFDLELV